MNIEIAIDSSCHFSQKKGIKIVTDFWGIHLIGNRWECRNNMCCPLGAVLLEYQMVYPENYFSKTLEEVRYNPTYAIMGLFNVDLAWVKSFWIGLLNSKILYSKYSSVCDLGYKYHQIYRANDI